MKTDDLRGLSSEGLGDRLESLHQEAFNLRFRNATQQLDNTARIRQVRKEIARIKTIAGQRATGAREE